MMVSAPFASTASADESTPSLGFTVSPGSGPVGTRVHFEGDVDPADAAAYRGTDFAYGLEHFFADTDQCEMIVRIDDLVAEATDDGHVTGSFVVGPVAGCFMDPNDSGPQAPRPGVYNILLSCHACTPIGTFTITESRELARTGAPALLVAGVGAVLVALGCALIISGRRFNRA
jgi:hypothetical protein